MPPNSSQIQGDTCPTATNNTTVIEVKSGTSWVLMTGLNTDIKKIVRIEEQLFSGSPRWRAIFTTFGISFEQATTWREESNIFRTRVVSCGLPVVSPEPPATSYDFTYNDTSTSCSYKYAFKDAWIGADGYPQVKWEISGASTTRAGCQGGRITGYVWSPSTTNRYVYNPEFNYGGGGGGNLPIGFKPEWGDIGGFLLRLMEFNDPGDHFRLTSVCETNAAGEPYDRAVDIVIPPGIRDTGASITVRLQALAGLMQGLKDFKQPICPPTRIQALGEPVTVRFMSEDPSDASNRQLRKSLTYRDQTASLQEVHVAHWEHFSWQAGPICVIHKGAPWGVPQVWAATAEEGKRVIRHAGQVAGVDPDATGEWIVTGSADNRMGRTGTMRVMHRSGLICVSKRPSSVGRPLLAVASSQP